MMRGYARLIASALAAFVLLLWPLNSVIAGEPPATHVLLISIDGATPDGLLKAKTPTIESLWRNGAYSWRARTILPSLTLPAHTSMLTGLTPEQHGVSSNTWMLSRGVIQLDTIFSLAKRHGLKTAMVVAEKNLRFLTKPGSLDHFEVLDGPEDWARKVALAATAYLLKERPHLLFVHFADADRVGHIMGWMSEDYLEAIGEIDQAIGTLLHALRQTGMQEKTLVLLAADHGGYDYGHGGADPRETTIPWIAFGPMVRSGIEIAEAITVYDTAATVLVALGIDIPPSFEGRPVREIFKGKAQNMEISAYGPSADSKRSPLIGLP